MKLMKLVVLILAISCIFGCAASTKQKPILTPELQVDSAYSGITENDVKNVIAEACGERGWKIDASEEGLIEASILVRNKHRAVIRIPYSSKNIRIEYKDSSNLLYEDKEGPVIHRNYNRWVNNLLHDITNKLTAISNSRIVK